MATYTGTPATWTAGQTVTAANLNNELRDPLSALSGAWNSYTPTVSTSTQGNGTTACQYLRFGKLVIGYASLTLGSTSSISTAVGLSLPVTAVGTGMPGLLVAKAYDTSAGAWYDMGVVFASTSVLDVVAVSTAGSYAVHAATSSSVPFTWATGDIVRVGFEYEAA